MTLRLPDELQQKVREQAAAEHVSVNEWFRHLAEEKLDNRRERIRDMARRVVREDAELLERLAAE